MKLRKKSLKNVTGSEITTVLTEDLWSALDALGAVPEAQHTEWYKRLEEAADAYSGYAVGQGSDNGAVASLTLGVFSICSL